MPFPRVLVWEDDDDDDDDDDDTFIKVPRGALIK